MVMNLNLDHWETLSLTAGCNLYSTKFRLCVLTVRAAEQPAGSSGIGGSGGGTRKDAAMYFRERDKPVVPTETFLATAVPEILLATLIIFINAVAILTLIRSNRNQGSPGSKKSLTSRHSGFFTLPQSTQGLLHSLFLTYLGLGLLSLYSQVSLSSFLLADFRLIESQGRECLLVNCALLTLSISIGLHMVSLSVDRTLSATLAREDYTNLSRGTVPLWLLSIWLPAAIVGSLPIAGWKANFDFCVFLLQFNEDYLRFVAGVFFSCIGLIPVLSLVSRCVLRRGQDGGSGMTIPGRDRGDGGGSGSGVPSTRTLYRWHRKLQAHHRLTLTLILSLNILCWAPFHIYLLLACQSCAWGSLAESVRLEWFFIWALVPSLLVPLVFTIRSDFIEKCVSRLSRCVTFHSSTTTPHNHHPQRDRGGSGGPSSTRVLPPMADEIYACGGGGGPTKSPLFFIDELLSSSSSMTTTTGATSKSVRRGHHDEVGTGSSTEYPEVKTPNFFVPRYLPPSSSSRDHHQGGHHEYEAPDTKSSRYGTTSSRVVNDLKSSFKTKYQKHTGRGVTQGSGRTLKNFCAYLNPVNPTLDEEDGGGYRGSRVRRGSGGPGGDDGANHYDSLESDMKYGFPILPGIHTTRRLMDTENYYHEPQFYPQK